MTLWEHELRCGVDCIVCGAVAACPANAAGAPNCACSRGFVGSLTWSSTRWLGNCTRMSRVLRKAAHCTINVRSLHDIVLPLAAVDSCPANAGGAPSCVCSVGYRGTLSWNDTIDDWAGSCACMRLLAATGSGCGACIDLVLCATPAVAACPSNAAGNPCKCNVGYRGSIAWNATSSSWSGGCTSVSCPPSTSGFPNCVCNAGFGGAVTWNDANDTWTSTCTRMPYALPLPLSTRVFRRHGLTLCASYSGGMPGQCGRRA
jgi:hypothetical protein